MSDVEMNQSQEIIPWLCGRVPNGYWELREHRVRYLDWLGRRLGFVNTDNWYQIRNTHFISNHGSALFRNAYSSSVYIAMQDYKPQYEWQPWLFAKVPKKFWLDARNRRAYMRWLGCKLQFHTEEDWYQITKACFNANCGAGLLNNYYHGSILSALFEYCPNYKWLPWLFPKVPHGFWLLPRNRKAYFLWLAVECNFRTVEDWYFLTKQDLRETGGSGMLTDFYNGSLTRIREDIPVMIYHELETQRLARCF